MMPVMKWGGRGGGGDALVRRESGLPELDGIPIIA